MVVMEDLSMADREELRLQMIQAHKIQEAGTNRGKTTAGEKTVLRETENAIIGLALLDMDLNPIDPKQVKKFNNVERNVVLDRFWKDVDVLGTSIQMLQRMVGKVQRSGATSQQQTPPAPPTQLMPLRQPAAATSDSTSPT